ncbi:MAG: hypothetical protein HFE83_07770 [Lachnospiraceae bacterium]|nr:hypothetical protein [Lachnospiraceae bacterium]
MFETIATSLPNMFTLEDIRELYHLRWGIDGVYPLDKSFRKAYRAGVTCACVRPGSVDCISGTHLAMKTYGRRIDSMAMKNPASMKAVFGENSKIHLKDRLTTRISIAAAIRDTLLFAKEYWEEKEYAEQTHTRKPCFDPKLEALRPIIKKEIPLKAYVLCTDDIFTTIRIAGECDVRLTLEHVTEGGLIADLLAKEG